MNSCFRVSFVLNKRSLIYYNKPCLKYFSVLSVVHDKTSNCFSPKHKYNTVHLKLIQQRNFSFDYLNSVEYAFCSSAPAKYLQYILVETHEVTNLPWWNVILLAGTTIKLFALFWGIFQEHLKSKLDKVRIELEGKSNDIKNNIIHVGRQLNWSSSKMTIEFRKAMIRERKALYVRDNCHPFKSLIVYFFNVPLWLFTSFSLKEISLNASKGALVYPVSELQFLCGGLFWCSNLSVPDETLILPIANALAVLLNGELILGQDTAKSAGRKRHFIEKVVFPVFLRIAPILIFLISLKMPAAIVLFWTTTSTLTVAQTLFLMSPRVRKFLRIPKTSTELERPYTQTWNGILDNWLKLLSGK